MTDLRTAAQQALEALVSENSFSAVAMQQRMDAITALRAALVEDAMQKFTDVNQELEAALAEPVQEPVAWSHINGTSDTKWHPPQRKPLSEDEALDIARTFGAQPWPPGSCVAFARAIERAHNITGDNT